MLLPYVFLGGLVRSRVFQAGAVGGLMTGLAETPDPGCLADELARALGDETLTLAFWLPEHGRYVDSTGQEVELPPIGSGRSVTPVERDGARIAAIIHDASLTEDSELVDAVGSAAALALENERLDAELRARLEDLRASRARLVEAGMAERRRLERDLHDGAQQRLVSLALSLRLARNKVGPDPDGAVEAHGRRRARAGAGARGAARAGPGHPPGGAQRPRPRRRAAYAGRTRAGARRPARHVAACRAGRVGRLLRGLRGADQRGQVRPGQPGVVQVEHAHGFVLVAVSDDGIGGADPGAAPACAASRDRVGALDGRLEVDSAPERGTTVRARIPCG